MDKNLDKWVVDDVQDGTRKRIEAYAAEYLVMRQVLGMDAVITPQESSMLYAIYRKDQREKPGNPERPAEQPRQERKEFPKQDARDNPASSKQKSWLHDLRKKGKIRETFDQIEQMSQIEASRVLDRFTK